MNYDKRLAVLEQSSLSDSHNVIVILLLPDWSSTPEPLFIVLPSNRDIPAKVRAFVDFAQALFSN